MGDKYVKTGLVIAGFETFGAGIIIWQLIEKGQDTVMFMAQGFRLLLITLILNIVLYIFGNFGIKRKWGTGRWLFTSVVAAAVLIGIVGMIINIGFNNNYSERFQ